MQGVSWLSVFKNITMPIQAISHCSIDIARCKGVCGWSICSMWPSNQLHLLYGHPFCRVFTLSSLFIRMYLSLNSLRPICRHFHATENEGDGQNSRIIIRGLLRGSVSVFGFSIEIACAPCSFSYYIAVSWKSMLRLRHFNSFMHIPCLLPARKSSRQRVASFLKATITQRLYLHVFIFHLLFNPSRGFRAHRNWSRAGLSQTRHRFIFRPASRNSGVSSHQQKVDYIQSTLAFLFSGRMDSCVYIVPAYHWKPLWACRAVQIACQ